jgi:hypothetical protein
LATDTGAKATLHKRVTYSPQHGNPSMIRLLAATVTAVALSTTVALAQKTMPADRVYDLHSERQGSCQPMNWHIVATAGGVLSGTIAWEDMKVVAGVAGTIRPLVNVERYGKPLGGNSQDRAFQMIATEDRGRIANITGTIWHNGWLTATIQGPGMACRNIKVQWLQPAPR